MYRTMWHSDDVSFKIKDGEEKRWVVIDKPYLSYYISYWFPFFHLNWVWHVLDLETGKVYEDNDYFTCKSWKEIQIGDFVREPAGYMSEVDKNNLL